MSMELNALTHSKLCGTVRFTFASNERSESEGGPTLLTFTVLDKIISQGHGHFYVVKIEECKSNKELEGKIRLLSPVELTDCNIVDN